MAILDALPPSTEAVAVMVKPERQDLSVMSGPLVRIGTVQWHDDRHRPRPWMTRQLISAFSVHEPEDLDPIAAYLQACESEKASGRKKCFPRAILVDAREPGMYGGTGKTAPWEIVRDFRNDLGGPLIMIKVPIILAGGLTPENIAQAVDLVRPWGVDVASGVESSPGRKDVDKMKRFIDNARAAS